ncbi:HPP family protein [Streptomyces sp. NPDC093544]|uniref:HPP family protein n=1 Tax=Streptomyces sp. NPDC093544 TaxID=3155200 RepID=UPI003430ADAA
MASDAPEIPEVVDVHARPANHPANRWWKPDEPRSPRRTVASAAITTSVGLAVLAAVGSLTHQTALVPPLAATMAIVTATPHSPLAQPRHVIGGHMLSCLVAFAVLALGWRGPWAAAVACGIACGLVLILKTAHPPAMATAVMIMLTHPPLTPFVPLLAVGAVLLIAVQMVSARLQQEVYPTSWW